MQTVELFKNKKGNLQLGLASLLVLFLIVIAAFSTIEPFKETLDNTRGDSSLNCPGTPNFNQTTYDDDSSFERLVRRPTCMATGFIMVVFILCVIGAGISWTIINFRR